MAEIDDTYLGELYALCATAKPSANPEVLLLEGRFSGLKTGEASKYCVKAHKYLAEKKLIYVT